MLGDGLHDVFIYDQFSVNILLKYDIDFIFQIKTQKKMSQYNFIYFGWVLIFVF